MWAIAEGMLLVKFYDSRQRCALMSRMMELTEDTVFIYKLARFTLRDARWYEVLWNDWEGEQCRFPSKDCLVLEENERYTNHTK